MASQKLACVLIAYDDLLGRIPFDLAADHHRDQAKVTRDGRMMSRFHRRDRRFSRFNAVEEIPLMIV